MGKRYFVMEEGSFCFVGLIVSVGFRVFLSFIFFCYIEVLLGLSLVRIVFESLCYIVDV